MWLAAGAASLLAATLAPVLATSSALAEDAGSPHRILIVSEGDSNQAAIVEIARGLHHGLDERSPTEFEMYSEFLDSARFPAADDLERIAGQLSAKYKQVKLEAVVTAGPVALKFMLDNRSRIAPGVPMLFGAVSDSTTSGAGFPPDVKGLVSKFDVKQTLALARLLQPQAKQAVIVFGSAPFDKRWETTAKAQLGERYLDFDVRYLTDLNLAGFADALRKLPRDTAVIVLSIFQDADGRKYVPREAAAKIAPESAAPVYSVYDTFLGKGVLGGYMGTFEDTGEQLAALVDRTIAGDASLPQLTPLRARPIVDWREITRFGMDAGRLPPETEIRYREPSLWSEYRAEILATAAVVLVQSGMIAALVVQGHRRKKAEAELATGRLELTHLSRTSLLGELSGAFAHELNQPLTSILANAETGRRLLDGGSNDPAELKEILSDIVDDDKRAAEVIAQLRRLLVKGEAVLEPIDLNQVVAATQALARSELVVRQTRLDFSRAPSEVRVLGNFAQLQQVVLNLVMNAVDATSHLPSTARSVEAQVSQRSDGFGELAVSDNGHGLSPEMLKSAFKPFVSTKPTGLGLGLAICRSIVAAHGGTLQFDPARQNGARVVLVLPLARRAA
jgi:signal transduction histidine kinase